MHPTVPRVPLEICGHKSKERDDTDGCVFSLAGFLDLRQERGRRRVEGGVFPRELDEGRKGQGS